MDRFLSRQSTRSFHSSIPILARTPEGAREEAWAKTRELRIAAKEWFQSDGKRFWLDRSADKIQKMDRFLKARTV
jgi:hypothetical protein